MFTGIVQRFCEVVAVEDLDGMRRHTVDLGEHAEGLELGASVANNGTCLSVTKVDGGLVSFDVIAETLRLTNLDTVQVGDRINIERSMRLGDEIGGHEVSGHVSTVGIVAEIERSENNQRTWIEVEERWMPYLHHKGFVALDGASLTISHLDPDRRRFAVSLIPETLERTTFGHHDVGDRVNLEVENRTQVIVDTITRMLSDPDTLARLGITPPPTSAS
ncbi:MAG: riboflavin synthase subunit alpha [Actinomycetota bacterium]